MITIYETTLLKIGTNTLAKFGHRNLTDGEHLSASLSYKLLYFTISALSFEIVICVGFDCHCIGKATTSLNVLK